MLKGQRSMNCGQPLAVILAGGKGTRLGKLTERTPKPGVQFGKHIIADYVVGNVVNSGVDRGVILVQYGSVEMIKHLERLNLNSPAYGKSMTIGTPNFFGSHGEFLGTANAVFQYYDFIAADPAEDVLILAADHIYKMDYRQMVARHRKTGADFTVCTLGVDPAAARNFGIVETDVRRRVTSFHEKPLTATPDPDTGKCCASIGVYAVRKDLLLRLLQEDHDQPGSSHDFGKDIIPKIVLEGKKVYSHPFESHIVPGESQVYWRDVGLLSEYLTAALDLASIVPSLDTRNTRWPIQTAPDGLPELKVNNPDRGIEPDGWDYRHCGNWIGAGGTVIDEPWHPRGVVLGRNDHIGQWCRLEETVFHDDVRVGPGAHLARVIAMKGARIPSGVRIGFDLALDRARGLAVYEDERIVIVPSNSEQINWGVTV